MKFTNTEFELFVAQYYQGKVDSCRERKIEWKLSLISVRNLLRTTKCPWTGIVLTIPRGKGKGNLSTDITIDRIDNTKGYIPGNVIAVSSVANNFKSIFENPAYPIDMLTAQKMLGKVQKRIKKCKGENK